MPPADVRPASGLERRAHHSPTIPEAFTKSPVSLAEFLHSHDEDLHAEWVDGDVIAMSPASQRHQDLANYLTTCVRLFTEAHRLGKALQAA